VSRVRDTASLGFLAISINDGDILHAAELMGESLLIETEFDPNAPLEWQDYTSQYAKDINWEDAVAYCHDLSFNSHDDWRLPLIEELRAAFQQSSTPLYNITTQLWSISEPAEIFTMPIILTVMKLGTMAINCRNTMRYALEVSSVFTPS